jgi:hypothetical protein
MILVVELVVIGLVRRRNGAQQYSEKANVQEHLRSS